MSIIFNFKNRRQNKRISQQSLALKVGISQSYLNQIENNTYKRSPTVELIERIAEVLDGGCFFDIVECNNTRCNQCRHKQVQYIKDRDNGIVNYYI